MSRHTRPHGVDPRLVKRQGISIVLYSRTRLYVDRDVWVLPPEGVLLMQVRPAGEKTRSRLIHGHGAGRRVRTGPQGEELGPSAVLPLSEPAARDLSIPSSGLIEALGWSSSPRGRGRRSDTGLGWPTDRFSNGHTRLQPRAPGGPDRASGGAHNEWDADMGCRPDAHGGRFVTGFSIRALLASVRRG